jgi:hypothetical protein
MSLVDLVWLCSFSGKDFMLEAIDFLKGVGLSFSTHSTNIKPFPLQVLAFEEIPSAKRPSTSNSFGTYRNPPIIHSRSQSQPLSSDQASLTIATTTQPKRARAPSDPFLDTPVLSRSSASSSSQSSGNTTALLTTLTSDGGDEPPSPVSQDGENPTTPLRGDFLFDDSEEEYLRIWTSPDLCNPEYLNLLKIFPSFITRRPLPRFPAASSSRQPDIEEGDEEGVEGKQIRFGTGSMWVGSKQRSDGWEGGWWTRFILWWKKTFC